MKERKKIIIGQFDFRRIAGLIGPEIDRLIKLGLRAKMEGWNTEGVVAGILELNDAMVQYSKTWAGKHTRV